MKILWMLLFSAPTHLTKYEGHVWYMRSSIVQCATSTLFSLLVMSLLSRSINRGKARDSLFFDSWKVTFSRISISTSSLITGERIHMLVVLVFRYVLRTYVRINWPGKWLEEPKALRRQDRSRHWICNEPRSFRRHWKKGAKEIDDC